MSDFPGGGADISCANDPVAGAFGDPPAPVAPTPVADRTKAWCGSMDKGTLDGVDRLDQLFARSLREIEAHAGELAQTETGSFLVNEAAQLLAALRIRNEITNPKYWGSGLSRPACHRETYAFRRYCFRRGR